MVKKGDTLVEVALAIGIFSMVAIAVVAVMVGGTSNAQNALETTLAREEIDTQAEALRFIHASYLADEETGADKDPYTQLWREITKDENVYIPNGSANDAAFQQYSPSSCQAVYKNTDVLDKAFVINPRALSSLFKDNDPLKGTDKDKIKQQAYFSYKKHEDAFRQTATHPRLIYGVEQENNTDALIDNVSNNAPLKYVEGLYVLAVKDPETTNIIVDASGAKKTSAYYDFYIRTCWYGAGSDSPSAISTVIRLYDPDSIASGVGNEDEGGIKEVEGKITYNTYKNGERTEIYTQNCISFPCELESQDTIFKDKVDLIPDGQQLKGWRRNALIIPPDGKVERPITLYAVWEPLNPTPDPTPDPEPTPDPRPDPALVTTSIRDLTTAGCKELASSKDLWVKDFRSGDIYTVRWINGKCWMTSDLRITGEFGGKYSNLGSDLDKVKVYQIRFGGDYVYYQRPFDFTVFFEMHGWRGGMYYSAKASQVYSVGTDYCPKNWHVPSNEEFKSLAESSESSKFSPSGHGRRWVTYMDAYLQDPGESYYWTKERALFNYEGRQQIPFNSDKDTMYTNFIHGKYSNFYLAPIRCVHK